jgi:hypothetical protein
VNRGRAANYNDYEERLPEKEEFRHKPQPKHETETILKCGTVTGSAPIYCNLASGSNGFGFNPIVLASVVLDTNKLIKPTIKIDFSSLISFKSCGDDNYFLRLTFKLSKTCDGNPIPLGSWTYEQAHHEELLDGDLVNCGFVRQTVPFSFSWCECDECPDCCRYIVEIIDQQCCSIDFAVVSNISLTALAVGLKNPHHE